MAATRKDQNRNLRKEALREQLRNKGLAQQVIEISEKLQQQSDSLESSQVSALKASAELKLKLVNKYLPDLKPVTPDVEFKFTEGSTPVQQVGELLTAVSVGKLPPDTAAILINSIKSAIEIELNTELKYRLENLEDLLNITSE